MTSRSSQETQLDYALKQLNDNLVLWGIDNWLGNRKAETIKLSVNGATNTFVLLDLVNTLNIEIARSETIVREINKGDNQ